MGDKNNWRNEWIELYNNTNQNISLNGWSLRINDKKISLHGEIDSFYLIKNKGVSAEYNNSMVVSFNLNNNGNDLTLLDNSNNIIDKATFASGWPAGDNLSKQTMERVTLEKWQSSIMPGGTPGKENSEKSSVVTTKSQAQIVKEGFNSFNKSFWEVLAGATTVSSFLGLIGLYLNLQRKNYNIDNQNL